VGQYSIRNWQNQRSDGVFRRRSAVSSVGEEIAQQSATFSGQDAPHHFDPLLVGVTVQQPCRADNTTGPGIRRPKNHLSQAR